MGTIKTGFWKMAFILTPDEFQSFIEYCMDLNIKPDRNNIYEQYGLFYEGLTAKTQPVNYLKQDNISFITFRSFVSGLLPENAKGFMINPANMVHWPYCKEAVRISSWAVQISLSKGVSVDKHEENGKYFVYEDIQHHSPQSYPLYQKLTTYIKSITKPLRFNAQAIDNIKEINPSVRISKQAAEDLANSWIFNEYEFKIKI